MPKSRKRKQRKPDPRPQSGPSRTPISKLDFLQTTTAIFRKVFSRTWTIFAGVGVVIGIAVFLYPRLSVSSSASLDPSNPFTTPFIISNDGVLPIHEVSFSCAPRQISTNTFRDVEFSKLASPIPFISGAEKATTGCYEAIAITPLTNIELDVVVRFQSYWIPTQQERHFRFITLKNKDGQFQWVPRALSE